MIFPGLVGPSYTSQSPNADAELCMNWVVEQMESPGAKVQSALYPTPGYATLATVAESPGRGVFSTGELTTRLFSAVGFKIYEYSSNFTATSRGTIDSDTNPATFATNSTAGGQMCFTSGGTLYCYTLSDNSVSAVATFVDQSIPILQVVYLNNRFIALDATASAIYWSALNDGSSWSLASKAVRSTAADPWVAMSVVLGQLWLLGTQTSDVYYPTADPNSPYQPIPGALLEQGCAAAFSQANLDSTLVWLASNANGRATIRRSNGYVPQRISTHAVEYAIQNYTTIDDAEAFAYQAQGHSYYVLTFPTEDATWVYDTATSLWHQRGYWNTATSEFLKYRARGACEAFGKTIVGDWSTGKLFDLSLDNQYDADGSVIRRVRRSPHAWDGRYLNRVRYPGLQIDMQTGLGVSELTGAAPQVALSWSDDGGLTYPTETLHAASAGNLGQYTTRVIFRNLGSSRDRVFQIVCSDPVPWRILQAVFRPDPIVGVH